MLSYCLIHITQDEVDYLIMGKMIADPGNMGPLHEWMPASTWPKVKVSVEGPLAHTVVQLVCQILCMDVCMYVCMYVCVCMYVPMIGVGRPQALRQHW